jgi:hypothetical protein
MKCVILQPSYIPWRGFFHQIAKADVFVFYDDVQYDRRGWRNRNRIKTAQGTRWLTIPVLNKGAQVDHTPIDQIRINWDQTWNNDHWKAIQSSYCKAPYFKEYAETVESFYNTHPVFLADFTIETTIQLAGLLNITHVRFVRSSSLSVKGQKTDRLIAILKILDADHYITGPSAKDYLDESKFIDESIQLEYMQYNYPEYPQLHPPYDPQVSILDLLFSEGKNSTRFFNGIS